MGLLFNSSSPIALWVETVHEAEALCNITLQEDIESYLVFLLVRFTTRPEYIKKVLATEFLTGLEQTARQQQHILQNVGDQCLIFSGFFPKQAIRRHVNVSYYVNLGQSAYSVISRTENDLYSLLASQFVTLMDVLQAFRQYTHNHPDLMPLEAYELWNETGSQRALSILKQYTQGTPLLFREKLPNR